MHKKRLPKPNVSYPKFDTGEEVSRFINERSIKGVMSNPIYTGISIFPKIISDEIWVKSAIELIETEGTEQFLVNMLYVLRETLDDYVDSQFGADSESLIEHLENKVTKLENNLLETAPPRIYCSHDNFPMIPINNEYTCIAAYIFAHLENAVVTDLTLSPTLGLVFHNGHTIPLLCPDCGQSLHADEDELLDALTGLVIVDIGWDDDTETVLLDFGYPDDANDEEDIEEDVDVVESLEVHLNCIKQITCPRKAIFSQQ
ncbi:MAG: hypothetical protein B6242_03045 [Anaerolineaceae bacterium 4572_78]|nr:MAG: hypothetical protein B6242_03045 [Anaerolineaceae bacterium 4572_78]